MAKKLKYDNSDEVVVKYAIKDSHGTDINISNINSAISSHTGNTNNPHSVTKAQVGLGSVINTGLDTTPTLGSTNYITSGGVYNYVSYISYEYLGTSPSGLNEEGFLAWANSIPTKTKNDYVFWHRVDTKGNNLYKKYTYDGTTWVHEYDRFSNEYTQAHWLALNSGISSGKVSGYDTHVADTTIHVTASDKSTWSGKQDALGFTPENVANKNTSVASSDTDYPTSKAVMDFVNSSISANAGSYISDNGQPFNDPSDLPTTSDIRNNDYAIVIISGDYYRYKATVNASVVTWSQEYKINNSSFTQAQLNAMNSGITSAKVSDYDMHIASTSNPHSVTKSQVGLGSVENKALDNTPTSGSTNYITSGAVYSGLASKQNTLAAGNGITLSNSAVSVDETVVATLSDTQTFTGRKDFSNTVKITGTNNLYLDTDTISHTEPANKPENNGLLMTSGVSGSENGNIYLYPISYNNNGGKAYYKQNPIDTLDTSKEIATKGDIPTDYLTKGTSGGAGVLEANDIPKLDGTTGHINELAASGLSVSGSTSVTVFNKNTNTDDSKVTVRDHNLSLGAIGNSSNGYLQLSGREIGLLPGTVDGQGQFSGYGAWFNISSYNFTAHRDFVLPDASGTIALISDVNAKYTKPSGGIPASDLATSVQTAISSALHKDSSLSENDIPVLDGNGKLSNSGLFTVKDSANHSVRVSNNYYINNTDSETYIKDHNLVFVSNGDNGNGYIQLAGVGVLFFPNTYDQTGHPTGHNVCLVTPNNLTANRDLTFPDKTGTIAITNDIPTKVSDLTNDSGFITSSAISGKEDTSNKVTTVSSSSTDIQYPSAKCVYNISYDLTRLSDYIDDLVERDLPAMLATKQNTLTAGTGISIVNNVISATGSSGTTLYWHRVGIWYVNFGIGVDSLYINILSSDPTPITTIAQLAPLIEDTPSATNRNGVVSAYFGYDIGAPSCYGDGKQAMHLRLDANGTIYYSFLNHSTIGGNVTYENSNAVITNSNIYDFVYQA